MSAEPPAAVYVDSSAIVKLVVDESESAALARHLRDSPNHVSCALARVEVVRAVRTHGPAAVARAGQVLRTIALMRLDDALLDEAATLGPGRLRGLDAIHLSAARALGRSLTAIVTYDHRMAEAAALLGMAVVAPA
jgi:predicted nucleic acid-binding protein